MEKFEEIEQTITKRFRKEIWKMFVKGISEYEMIQDGDKIAVCISGGKDSMLLAKCIQQLKKISNVPSEAEYIVMDPGYNQKNRERIIENAKILGVPIHIFESNIFSVVANGEGTPCYLCAKMRRGALNQAILDMGFTKLALGHHYDDAVAISEEYEHVPMVQVPGNCDRYRCPPDQPEIFICLCF